MEDEAYVELLKVGKQANIECDTIHKMPSKVTAEDVTDAYVKSLK